MSDATGFKEGLPAAPGKRGRKPMADGKSSIVQFRASDALMEEVAADAAKQGISASEWWRRAARGVLGWDLEGRDG
jgi:hypothetical protein